MVASVISARLAAILKDNGWALNLVFIAFGSYFTARAGNAVVARTMRILPSIEDMQNSNANKRHAGPSTTHASFTSTAERNLFAIKRENLNPAGEGTGPDGQPAEPSMVSGRNYNESDLRPCAIPAVLRATLVAEGEPEWSSAVLVNNNTHEAEVYTINEGDNQIAEDAFLVDVRSREIVVRRRDHFERCSAEGEGNTQVPGPVPQVAVPEPPTDGTGGEGVTKVSETQYTVDRAEVDKALSNLNEVATQARIVPSFKNGKANGFKLFSIKPGSIYSKIGLQNGDVIQKINGYEINSPDKALESYQQLKGANAVSIELQRRGQAMSFSYNIH